MLAPMRRASSPGSSLAARGACISYRSEGRPCLPGWPFVSRMMKQASRPVDKGEARPIFQYNRRFGGAAMLPKSVIACLAASAFGTGALMPTGASAVKGGPMPGTWNWPPYAGSGGGMPGSS